MVKMKDISMILGIGILAVCAFFETAIYGISPSMFLMLQMLSIVLIMLGSLKKGSLRFNKHIPNFFMLWILMIPFFLYGMLHNEWMVPVRILICLLFVYIMMNQTHWLPMVYRIMTLISGISVLATLFFYVVPQAYQFIVDFYGYYPPGTGRLVYGYRAGVSPHYSQNALFISIFLMLMMCRYLSRPRRISNRTQRRIELVILIMGMVALVLTGKRGTMLWCILAIAIVSFIQSGKKFTTAWKIVSVCAVALVVLVLLSESVPQIEHVINRFIDMGSDSSSMERMAMWGLALSSFVKSPIFGIGFQNYRGLYSTSLYYLFASEANIQSYQRLDAHNVYLQVLCETGVVGFLLYMTALVLLFMCTLRLVRYYSKREPHLKAAALFSLCIQIFYLLYSLSGNCLYDMTFYFYAFALAMTAALHIRKRKEIKYARKL